MGKLCVYQLLIIQNKWWCTWWTGHVEVLNNKGQWRSCTGDNLLNWLEARPAEIGLLLL